MKRKSFLKFLGLSGLIPASKIIAPDEKQTKQIHLHDFYVAGFKYYDGPEILDQLKVGDELSLVREPENKHDSQAVAIFTKDGYKLGYIPAESNIVAKNIIDNNIKSKCIIAEIDKNAEPWDVLFVSFYQEI